MDIQFFDVILVTPGKDKIKTIQALRQAVTHESVLEMMDLAQAKRLVDAAPCVIAPNITRDVAERVKQTLEKAGATIELKSA